eukprot:9442746-Pyramimonas_sp.AAC.1
MSQAKQAYTEGCLKRNDKFLKNVSSENSNSVRMCQAKPKKFLGGRLKRNEQCFKDVSSKTSISVRMS